MIRLALALGALLALLGCARAPIDLPDTLRVAEVQGRYQDPDLVPALTLITVRNNFSGSGGHTALLIEAPEETVIFDPAGSFHHAQIRREGDVLTGMSPAFRQGYLGMHARLTHNVLTQRVEVPAAVASRALALAYARGSVGSAYCARSVSGLLGQLPGFEGISQTFFPNALSDQFEALTGVAGEILYEDYRPGQTRAEAEAALARP